MPPLLEVSNLRLEIATISGVLHPVRGIDFAVGRGETLAIVGESGCGKSLTALAIVGLLPRNGTLHADKIALDGDSLLGLSERQWGKVRGRRIAMIFQDPMTAFDPCYRIGDQMSEIVRRHRPHNASRASMVEMLSKVGVTSPRERLAQYPHQLSGGLRQRVMIATALLCEPELLIADEPTTALDVTIQAQILRLLADLQRETSIGLIIITHDLGVVAGIANRIVVMYGGQVVESGTTRDILGSPQHPYTEGLMRCIPTPGKLGRRQALGFIPGVVPQPVGPLTACRFLDRCSHAFEACRAEPVALYPLEGGRAVRCLRAERGEPSQTAEPEAGV